MASVNKSKVAEAAQKLLAKGQIDKALKEYEKILKADPSDSSTRLKVGDLKLRLGQKDPAILEYRRVAEKFTQEGFYSKAVAVLKRIIAVEPQLLEAHLELASLNQKLGLLSEVVHHYQLAANIHDRRGEKRQAIDILKQVADVGPPNLERKIKVAELYYREGLKDSGFAQFEAAVAEIDPQSAEIIPLTRRMWKACAEDHRLGRRYAELCLAREDAKSAAEALEEMCGAVRDPELIEMLAEAKVTLDLAGEAKTLFEEAADLYRTRGNAARSQAIAARAVEIASAALDMALDAANPLAAASPPVAEAPLIAQDRPAQPLRPSEMTEEQHLEAALSEADVYQKYGKHDRAVTILEELATRYPNRHEAPLRLRAIFETCEDWISVGIQCRRLARVAEGRGDAERAARFEEQALQAELRAQQPAPPAIPPQVPPEVPPKVPSVARPVSEKAARADSIDVDPPKVPSVARPVSEKAARADSKNAARAIHVSQEAASMAGLGAADAELGDIELVIEGEDEPGIATTSPAASITATSAKGELDLRLDEEPAALAGTLLSTAGPAARGDEPDLILEDVVDGASPSLESARPSPEQAARTDLGEIALDIEEAPEAPRARSVEEELILQEISAETGSRPDAEKIVSSARLQEPRPPADSGDTIALGEPEPSAPGASVEASEIVLLDAPTDEETEYDGALDPFNLPPLEERGPAPGHGTPGVGTVATAAALRAPEAMADGGFELDLDLDSEEPAPGPAVDAPRQEAPAFGDSDFDLRAELALDGAARDAVADATKELSELVSELQQQEESVPSPEDAQTHYDLAIAYKEMGLLDDAIRELKLAARDPGRRVECLAVLGICYCEQGKPEEALGMFEQCLALGGTTGKGAAGILYEMGLVHEEAGNATEALECYLRVAGIDSDYRETRARVDRLRAAGADGPREPSRPRRSKRISYL